MITKSNFASEKSTSVYHCRLPDKPRAALDGRGNIDGVFIPLRKIEPYLTSRKPWQTRLAPFHHHHQLQDKPRHSPVSLISICLIALKCFSIPRTASLNCPKTLVFGNIVREPESKKSEARSGRNFAQMEATFTFDFTFNSCFVKN